MQHSIQCGPTKQLCGALCGGEAKRTEGVSQPGHAHEFPQRPHFLSHSVCVLHIAYDLCPGRCIFIQGPGLHLLCLRGSVVSALHFVNHVVCLSDLYLLPLR